LRRFSPSKTIKRFVIVGVCAVFLDFLTYRVLQLVIDFSISKGIGFIVGAVFSFLANRQWAFRSTSKGIYGQILRFCLVYFVSLNANVYTNNIVVETCSSFLSLDPSIAIGFFASTLLSAMLNYIGLKKFVFAG